MSNEGMFCIWNRWSLVPERNAKWQRKHPAKYIRRYDMGDSSTERLFGTRSRFTVQTCGPRIQHVCFLLVDTWLEYLPLPGNYVFLSLMFPHGLIISYEVLYYTQVPYSSLLVITIDIRPTSKIYLLAVCCTEI
jgi:hypothetical protein